MQVRSATHNDAGAIARIYNQDIEDRVVTFETRFHTTEDVRFSHVHPKIFSRRQH